MATTKSGIETPAPAPKESLAVVTKNYPGSSKLGGGKNSGIIDSPAKK